MTSDTSPDTAPRRRPPWLMPLLCLVAGVAGALAVIWLSPRPDMPAGDKVAMQKVVEEAILANPQIIPDAITRLQQMEVEKLLTSNREAIETPFAGAWAGAGDGDVVLVEFFDYNCPFCRRSAEDVARLLEEDSQLKVVFRDFPVLGPDSERFARASLAAAQQGQKQFLQFYRSVFASQGPLDQKRLIQSVRQAGMNESKVAATLESRELGAEIDRNLSMGRALGLTGTPSYIVGNEILSGAVGYDALKQAIAKARNGNA